MMMTLEMANLMMMIILMKILTITLMMMIPSTVNVGQRRGDVIMEQMLQMVQMVQ